MYPPPWRVDADYPDMFVVSQSRYRAVVAYQSEGTPPTDEWAETGERLTALALYPDLLAEVDRLRARVAQLEGVMRSVEWGCRDATSDGIPMETCPKCHEASPLHAPDCALDAALSKEATDDATAE